MADDDIRRRELVSGEILLACQLLFEDVRVVPEHTLPLFEPLLTPLGLRQQEQVLSDLRDGVHQRRLAEMQPRQELAVVRSEEHTSELQSRENIVCRLLLEKKTE